MKSLRDQLIAFWIILLSACVALGVVMLVLFRSSAGAQIEVARTGAEQACRSVAVRYAKSLADASREQPQLDLLQVILRLVLLETPHVEGGVWSASGGFLAYAYPTYEGSGAKTDIPPAEQPHITEIAQIAARGQQPQTDVVRASREALIVSACPLASPRKDLAAWTMTRTASGTLVAQDSLRVGLVALLVGVLASGLWLGVILLRGYRHVQRLEATLAVADANGASVPALAQTGLAELDRVVDAFNLYRTRFDEARARLAEAQSQRSRDQRLAALGRMTGGIAHEIRNPIAAMRLKAENALAASPDRHADALTAILGQIARLDGLVQSLLAVVQPIQLQAVMVDVPAWLAERVASFARPAQDKHVRIEVRCAVDRAMFDPLHLARAVDNLLDNAVRHAPTGGEVLLEAKRIDAARWQITVSDDGPGVSAALRSQLFEPFATGRADGTGLGLALAREVAFAHGGDLRLGYAQNVSGHPARSHPGAHFELELPWRAS